MVDLDADPDRLERQDHVRADVLELVHRRDRKVALLVARLVAEVRLLERALLAGVPEPGLGVDEVVARVVVLVEADRVEEEELELGTDVDRVREAGLLQIRLGLLRDVAGVARVPLAGDRVLDVADQHERRHGGERVHLRRRRIGDQEHVRLVDRLEAPDRGAVEAEPLLEDVLVQLGHRDREVLPEARQVDEAEIDDLGALLLGQLERVLRRHARLLLVCVVSGPTNLGERPARIKRLRGGGHGLSERCAVGPRRTRRRVPSRAPRTRCPPRTRSPSAARGRGPRPRPPPSPEARRSRRPPSG